MSSPLITSIEAMRSTSRQWRQAGQRIAFVPTMGNLHAGHLQLVKAAKANADRVVVSIFVNPLQFGPGEDFNDYPRTLDEDRKKLKAEAVDGIFAPAEKAFYRRDNSLTTYVEVPGLSDILCGASRPGHFRGVSTVVNKLFNIVQPDIAVFGTKDFQQFTIIRQMVDDLAIAVELLGVDTVREPDGLAMSSRNAYLTAEQREVAPELYKTLSDLRQRLLAGEQDFTALEQEARNRLLEIGFKVDYLEIRDGISLARPENGVENRVVLTAVWLGETRLIDNILI